MQDKKRNGRQLYMQSARCVVASAWLMYACVLVSNFLAPDEIGGSKIIDGSSGTGFRKLLASDAISADATFNAVKAGAEEPSCEETYGIFPCSSSLAGSIFLCATYGYLLLVGANLISDGSELLLEVMDPGLIGGLLLPVLGALPDSAMIVVSGMGGSLAEAQEQVVVGMGTLAGSTVMMLSVAWGGSLIVGRCDIDGHGNARDKKLTRGWGLLDTGVTSDEGTQVNAYIMVASAFLYLIPQFPVLSGQEQSPTAALVGGVACVVTLAAYCVFQVVWPDLQKRKKAAAVTKARRAGALQAMSLISTTSGGALLAPDGSVNQEALRALFNRFDSDGSGKISRDELRGMVNVLNLGTGRKGTRAEVEDEVAGMLKDIDADGDGSITFAELLTAVRKWNQDTAADSARAGPPSRAIPPSRPGDKETDALMSKVEEGLDAEEDDDDEEEDEEDKVFLSAQQIIVKASGLLLAGTAVVAVISDPMVDAVSSLSKTSGIPAFFVAFIITPFASNASELVSSINFAKKKKKKNISLTYSQVYGAVTMNNTMCLGLFLLVVWYRGLAWNFSAEVVTIMASVVALGIVASSRRTFPLYWAFVSLALYPVALALVYFLDNVLGWH